MDVLTVNAGSGSLALHVVSGGDTVARRWEIDGDPAGGEARDALDEALIEARAVDAVGHRLVHGGPDVMAPAVVDDRLRDRLDAASSLAPLHLPPALAALDRARQALEVPHVVCPDTAFHEGLPEHARTYAVPVQWREQLGVRRYGFHGVSYAWALERAAMLLDREADDLQLVLAHLGGGASVCAVRHGRSVATSMGMTPLEGLVMVKRAGSVDPGLLLWLLGDQGLSVEEVSDGLQQQGGLIALSEGRSGDTRELVAAARGGHAPSRLALDVFAHRARQEIAAAAASLDRLDALVFTGEIGADQPELREAIAGGLPVLGLAGDLDPGQEEDRVVSRTATPVLLVHPREELQVARMVTSALADARPAVD